MDFSWAVSYPDVYKVCTLFQMTELANPVSYKYKKLDTYLQDGPQCGLIALAMIMGHTNKESVNKIYESAKDRNFTYNGEMFSVADMALLAEEQLPNETKIEVYKGCLDTDFIKKFILDGGMLLVPYDTEKDNSPGFSNGHKAHWAVISGGILTKDDFYVLARHGKAINVAVWKLIQLAKSNKQLFEFSPNRKLHNVQYKLPEGGISGPLGLNSQSILIKLPE